MTGIESKLNAFQYLAKTIDPGRWQGVELDKRIKMWEHLNSMFTMPIPELADELQKETVADQPWSEKHFKERMSGEPLNPGETYKIWPWNNFKDGDDPFLRHNDKFSHTYMERYYSTVSQPELMVRVLFENPDTRQAFFPVWDTIPDARCLVSGDRVPCSLGYWFNIRDGKLNVTYYIRSCDILRHFRNDVYLTSRLVQWVAEALQFKGMKVVPGELTMHIGSFHLFHTDKYALEKREDRKFPRLTIK